MPDNKGLVEPNLCNLLWRNLEETSRKAATFSVFIFACKETKF